VRKDRRDKANGSQSRIYERTYFQNFGAKTKKEISKLQTTTVPEMKCTYLYRRMDALLTLKKKSQRKLRNRI